MNIAEHDRMASCKSSDSAFERQLQAYIMTDQHSEMQPGSAPQTNENKDILTLTQGKELDKDLDGLLNGIEKGQLENQNMRAVTSVDDLARVHLDRYLTDSLAQIKQEDSIALHNSTNDTHSTSDEQCEQLDLVQSDVSDNEEESDYELTQDQKRASLELEQLRAESECLPDGDPPEYDVKDRIKQLNAELAKEPLPNEDMRKHKVMFKEDPVDLVVPPSDIEDEPSTDRDSTCKQNGQDCNEEFTEKYSEDISSSEPVKSRRERVKENSHNVLIERDGKFELVSSDDIQALDLGILSTANDSVKPQHPGSSSLSKQRKSDLDKCDAPIPQPPSIPHPASRVSEALCCPSPTSRRPHSAVVHVSVLKNFNYTSPYGLTQEEKVKLREMMKRKETQEKQEQMVKKEEELLRRKENEEAFEAWLKKKRNSITPKWTGTDTGDKKTENANEKNFFTDWLRMKKEQSRREKLLKRREEEERHCGQPIRSKDQCEEAFKQWLRKKSYEACRRRRERKKHGLLALGGRYCRSAMPNKASQLEKYALTGQY